MLRISPELELPLDFVTATLAILAQKGKGKSYTAAVITEEMLEAGQQVVLVDPTGAHWGLRSSADGKGAGYPIVILGGEHGDVALESTSGAVIAEAIATEHFSAVIDLSLFTRGEELRFMSAFLETLYRKNREALHIVIDEADVVAPQRPMGEDARTLGATQNIVRRGRIRGLGCTLITQRPQVLNKDVLSQADMLCVLGMNHPKDLGAIDDWVAVHGDAVTAKKMIAGLPKLPRGRAWWWWPAADVFAEIAINRRRTFDSGATPKPGERKQVAKVLAPVDIARLGSAIAETVERAKETDTKALRAELAKVRAQLEVASAAQIPREVEEELQRLRALSELDLELADVLAKLGEADDHLVRLVNRASELRGGRAGNHRSPPAPPRAAAAATPARTAVMQPVRAGSGPGDATLGKAQRAILTALAQHRDGCTKAKVALLAGYSANGGGFNNSVSALRTAGHLEGTPDRLTITGSGLRALGAYDLLPATGEPLREHWLRELDKAGAAIIRALASEGGSAAKDFVALKAGYEPSGGGFNNALSRLRTLGLVEGSKKLVLAEELR